MVGVHDVNGSQLVSALGKVLKDDKDLKAPVWTVFVKTGVHAERPPENKDWWYVRLAALLRTLYIDDKMGVQRLRNKFGGRRKVSYRHKRHFKAGGKIIRVGLQMLEKKGLVVTVPKKGRILSDKGKSLVDKVAAGLVKKL